MKPALRATLGKLGELSLTHVATFAFPLVFAVVCGRTLGLHDYGIVSFYTALSAFLGMFIEFGFDWHGIREVTQNQHDPRRSHRVLWNITAIKLGLCTAAMLLTWLVLAQLRSDLEAPLMIAAAVFLVGFALDASWYVRAIERTRMLLAITTGVRLVGILVLLLVVTRVATKESALWTYAWVSLATSALTWACLLRSDLVQRAGIEWSYMCELMQRSWAIVLGNLNGALLTNGGIALLGLTADPSTVGAASLALRVRMAGQAVLLPIQQLGFVRISGLARSAPGAAVSLGRRLLMTTLPPAVLVTLASVWLAPDISAYVFKTDVPLATLMIMLLAMSLPIQAVGNLYGLQSLVAFGKERAYALIQVLATLAFGAALFTLQSDLAYGWAVLVAESLVLVTCALQLNRITTALKS